MPHRESLGKYTHVCALVISLYMQNGCGRMFQNGQEASVTYCHEFGGVPQLSHSIHFPGCPICQTIKIEVYTHFPLTTESP